MKELTIIMPFLDEGEEPKNTIDSIYATTDAKKIEIIVIDDCSSKPSIIPNHPEIRLIRNPVRVGVDASRQIGIDLTTTPYLFIIDAHMRFSRGWLDLALECVSREPETAWCTTCMQLGYGITTLERSTAEYAAATMVFLDKNIDPNKPAREVLEPKWMEKRKEIEYEVPCVLGANYIFSKKWIDHIKGLSGLKMWGTSEPFISLKSWFAGGKCKINRRIRVGHFFRDSAPYTTYVWPLIYNKIFLCKTILPEEISNKLIGYMQKNSSFELAMEEIIKDNKLIEENRQYYQNIFKFSIQDYCQKFNIQIS